MFRAVLSIVVSLTLNPAVSAAAQSLEAAPETVDATARIDSLLTAAHQRGIFHGTALVAHDGRIVYQGSFGVAGAAGSTALTPRHRYLIGSVEKEFSAVALMVLEEDGALDLDESVGQHLPTLPGWADSIRIAALLTYTSGLPQIRYGEVADDADVYSDLRELRDLQFEPGTAFSYNNNDIFLRKRIIEAASGRPYADFLRTRVLEPCGMTDAVTDPGSDDPLFARSLDNEGVADEWRTPTSGHTAVTALDLYRWTQCVHSEDVISHSSLMALTREFNGGRSALGQSGVEGGAIQWHAHIGQVASYEALQYVSLVDGITMIMLTNNKQQRVAALGGAVEQALLGKTWELPKKSLEIAIRARILHHCFDAGIELLEEIEREAGEDFDLSQVEEDLTEAGEYLLEMGAVEEAVQMYEFALSRYPESTAARSGLEAARRAASS